MAQQEAGSAGAAQQACPVRSSAGCGRPLTRPPLAAVGVEEALSASNGTLPSSRAASEPLVLPVPAGLLRNASGAGGSWSGTGQGSRGELGRGGRPAHLSAAAACQLARRSAVLPASRQRRRNIHAATTAPATAAGMRIELGSGIMSAASGRDVHAAASHPMREGASLTGALAGWVEPPRAQGRGRAHGAPSAEPLPSLPPALRRDRLLEINAVTSETSCQGRQL